MKTNYKELQNFNKASSNVLAKRWKKCLKIKRFIRGKKKINVTWALS